MTTLYLLEGAPHNDAPDWTDWEFGVEGADEASEEIYVLSRNNETGEFYAMHIPDSATDAVVVRSADLLESMKEMVGA